MSKIKTKKSVKDIKALDKASDMDRHMKNAFIRSKDNAVNLIDDGQASPSEYAEDKVQYAAQDVVHDTGHTALNQGKNAIHKSRELIRRRKELHRERPEQPSYDLRYEERARTAKHLPKKQPNSNDSEIIEAVTPNMEYPSGADYPGELLIRQEPITARRNDGLEIMHNQDETLSPKRSSPVEQGRQLAIKRAEERVERSRNAGNTSPEHIEMPGNTDTLSGKAEARREDAPKHSASLSTEKTAKSTSPPKSVVSQPHNVEQTEARIKPTQVKRDIRQSARSAGKTSVKTSDKSIKSAGKSIKTAEQSAKTSVKTAEASAKAIEKGAQATAKASQKTAQAARAAAKAAAKTAKAVAKALADAVKASAEAIKSLVAMIGSGGAVALIIVVLICLIGMIAGSAFGIFFSSQPSQNSSETMFQVVRQINDEYINRIENIKATAIYDDLEMSGSRAVWKEVLAVYAVKTATDPTNAQDVATMTPQKKQILKDIFWAMNSISHTTGIYYETQYVEKDDGKGNITVEEVKVLLIRLYITVTHKTAAEMAAEYHFSDAQKSRMNELLSDEYNSVWTSVLYGIDSTDDAIVAVALSQIGNVGGATYWSWYGFTGHVDWCACFVSWCANECGYIENGIIPQYASCRVGIDWFQGRNQWAEPDIEPSPGMIIFFDWDKDGEGQDGVADHTGIVEKVESGYIYTIEGNSGDTCRECRYPIGHYEIFGYGLPAY